MKKLLTIFGAIAIITLCWTIFVQPYSNAQTPKDSTQNIVVEQKTVSHTDGLLKFIGYTGFANATP